MKKKQRNPEISHLSGVCLSAGDAEFRLLYFLTGALIFSTILAVLLIITLYNMNRSTSTGTVINKSRKYFLSLSVFTEPVS